MKFIWGDEGFLVEQEINKEIRKLGVEPIIYTDDDSIENIVLDMATDSMFEEKKLIIIKNHSSFVKNDDVEELIDMISKTKNEILFWLEVESLDKNSKLVKFLKKKAEVVNFTKVKETDVIGIIKKIVESKGGTIDNQASITLSLKIPGDLRIVVAEIDKLLAQSKHINAEMIKTSVGSYLKDDFFALSNAVASGNAYDILKAYKDKKEAGIEPIALIGQISSILLLSLSIDNYRKLGFSNKEVANKMKIHPFRIKKAAEIIDINGSMAIKERVNDLADLDANIKTGKIQPTDGLEHYLLKLVR